MDEVTLDEVILDEVVLDEVKARYPENGQKEDEVRPEVKTRWATFGSYT